MSSSIAASGVRPAESTDSRLLRLRRALWVGRGHRPRRPLIVRTLLWLGARFLGAL